jgi:hypothetical protein
MSSVVSGSATQERVTTSLRANALAARLEAGAEALIAFATSLTDEQWQARVPGDWRKVGVTVHHVANMYPIEIQLAQALAAGKPIQGVTWDDVAAINAEHAAKLDAVTKEQAIAALRAASAAAAAAVRAFSDEELDRANTVSLNDDAPLTCQFFIEDHALRHSYHHLAKLRTTLGV